MAARKATLENVRRAVTRLQLDGDRPSANNVLAIVGGSKKSVLDMMRIVMSEQAASLGQADEGHAFASEVAAPVIARLWSEAMHRAVLTLQERIDLVGDLRDEFMAELASALDRADEMTQRAATAEERVEVLETELRAQQDLTGTLAELRSLVTTLRPKPTMSAAEQCLLLLADAPNGLSRTQLRGLLVAKGYSRGEANTGRYRIVKDWHDAVETGGGRDPIAKLTKTGKAKVKAMRAAPDRRL